MNQYDQGFMETLRALPPQFGITATTAAPLPVAPALLFSRTCSVYRSVRPILKGTMRIIEGVPVIGAGANQVLTLLVKEMDAMCRPGGEENFMSACHVYRYERPILVGILRFVSEIPQIGVPVGRALMGLMNILDDVCASAVNTLGASNDALAAAQGLQSKGKTACGCGCC